MLKSICILLLIFIVNSICSVIINIKERTNKISKTKKSTRKVKTIFQGNILLFKIRRKTLLQSHCAWKGSHHWWWSVNESSFSVNFFSRRKMNKCFQRRAYYVVLKIQKSISKIYARLFSVFSGVHQMHGNIRY